VPAYMQGNKSGFRVHPGSDVIVCLFFGHVLVADAAAARSVASSKALNGFIFLY
jgi:hypothetical protein